MSQVASGAEIVEGPRLSARSVVSEFLSKYGYPLGRDHDPVGRVVVRRLADSQ